ncbi:unnamed protein product [Effrenium voratum]|uniref:sn-1-specific diacylglycerol lipase n=1 Tax=Effrenium voratum TaxID=2562239 RepID=A0AA36J8T0_9DINO|nr:unnamed protein product [Effrenium voratum]
MPGMAQVLFLDVDGVLHPALPGGDVFLPDRLRLLSEALAQLPRARVVLSSTWRLDEVTDQLAQWQANREVEAFAVLDDDERLEGDVLQDTFVRTDPEVGINDVTAAQILAERLRRPAPEGTPAAVLARWTAARHPSPPQPPPVFLLLAPAWSACAKCAAPAIAGDAISHVFFTSGSTGKPKGCVVAHCSLYKLGAESVCLVASAHTFDPSLGDFARVPRVALDAVTLGQQGVTWGFGIAKAATQLGFGVANTAVQRTGEVGGPAAQVVTGGVQQVLAFAQGATHFGQDLAQGITQASLGAARMSLGAAGAQEGELLRLAVGDEAAESVMMVLQMVRRFCSSLGPVTWAQLMLAARAWTGAQQAARLELNARGPFQPVMLPPHAERAMRFSAATFGAQFLAGLADGLVAPAVRAYGAHSAGGDAAQIALAAAKVEGRVDVLAFESTSEHFVPGYMVAVDQELGCVVVALRGTSGAKDVLVDLVCEAAPCELAGVAGEAHGGMLRAAQRLSERLPPLVLQGLERLEPGSWRSPHVADVLVTGHSLGGGVAALLSALWRDQAALPPGRVLQCITFGCPQALLD